jgi:Flp pilus assembly protein TadD
MPKYDPTLRRKRVFRLSILAAILILLGGGIFALFQLNRTDLKGATDAEIIAQAQQAFEEEDYQLVLDLIENPYNRDTTLAFIDDDTELLRMYITARKELPLFKKRHIARTVGPLRKLIALDANDRDSENELLDAMLSIEQYDEAIKYAKQLAKKYPEDASVLRKLASAQHAKSRPKEALETLYLASKLEPLHVMTHIDILGLLQEFDEPTEPFVEFAEEIYNDHPKDTRAVMIRALAYEVQGDKVQARDMLQQASTLTPPDQETVALLVRWLDRSGMHKTAEAYLLQHAEPGIESNAARMAIYRAFETQRYEDMLVRLKDSDPRDANTDLLAMWASVHLATGDEEQFKQRIEGLKKRDSVIAQTWANLLTIDHDGNAKPAEMIDMIVSALRTKGSDAFEAALRGHPYFTQRLGEAYMEALEYEAAYGAFLTAAKNSETWARPQHSMAQVLLKLDQPQAAFVHAKSAHRRQANDETGKWLVLAMAAYANADEADAVDMTLHEADQLDKASPQFADVQPAVIDLMIRAGRVTQAKQRITDILNRQDTVPVKLLESLAQLSQQHQLEVTEAIAKKLEAQHGKTRGLALIRARAKGEQDGYQAGLAVIQQDAPKPIDKSWETAIVGYMVSGEAPEATSKLIELANRYPDDITLQLSALQACNPTQDQDFFEKAITRLRENAGEATIHWRLHQARLRSQDAYNTQAMQEAIDDLSDAEDLAPVHFQLQLSLARCHMLLEQDMDALEHAKSAKTINPNDPYAMMLHGKALHRLKRYEEARLELVPLARSPQAETDMRLDACKLLFEQGERKAVGQALESLRAAGQTNNEALILLASVYVDQQAFKQADEICEVLLQNPDAEAIRFVANYFRQTDRSELADQAISNAQLAGVSDADRMMIRAEDAASKGNTAEALELILQSAQAQPNNISRWNGAVRLAIALAEPEQAVRFAKLADKQIPGQLGLIAIIKHGSLINQIAEDQSLIPLAVTILQDEAHRQAAITALGITKQQNEPKATANQLADLSDKHADFKHLTELAMDRLVRAGQDERAFAMAPIAMARFPDSAASARIATLTSFRMRDWTTLLSAANAWAQRNPKDRSNADLMRAAAMLELDRNESAVKTLRPYISPDQAINERNEMLYELYTRALVLSGETSRAWQLLSPQLESSRPAQLIALKRIADDLKSSQTAESWLNSLSLIGDDSQRLFDTATAAFVAGQRLNSNTLVLRAQEQLTRLQSLPGTHGIEVDYAQAQIAQHLRNWDIAEAGYRKVLTSVPNNPYALNNLAVVLVERGASLDEAEQLAKRATQLSSKDPNLFDTLAIVHLKQRKLTLALKAIDQAIALDNNSAAWWLTKADILEARGETDRAQILREQYQQHLQN